MHASKQTKKIYIYILCTRRGGGGSSSRDMKNYKTAPPASPASAPRASCPQLEQRVMLAVPEPHHRCGRDDHDEAGPPGSGSAGRRRRRAGSAGYTATKHHECAPDVLRRARTRGAADRDEPGGVVDGCWRRTPGRPACVRDEVVVAVRLGGEQTVVVLVQQPVRLVRRPARASGRDACARSSTAILHAVPVALPSRPACGESPS